MALILSTITFIILGILIKYGRMYFLIAGYNTMSEEEKAKYDVEKIATLFRNVMFGMAAALILVYVLNYWINNSYFEITAFFLVIGVGVTYLLVKANSKSYRVKE